MYSHLSNQPLYSKEFRRQHIAKKFATNILSRFLYWLVNANQFPVKRKKKSLTKAQQNFFFFSYVENQTHE